MAKKQKRVTVEIISLDKLSVGEIDKPGGWGPRATNVEVDGKIAMIEVAVDSEAKFGIRILEDGSLILTNYRSNFTTMVESNLRLENTRPWE